MPDTTNPISGVGVIGLGVMGRNIALNLRDHGWRVVGWDAVAAQRAKATDSRLETIERMAELTRILDSPRLIWLMVPAGDPVDEVLGSLAPLLEPGDIVIDGGNSRFADTARRERELERRSVSYLGVGVSGGEAGALDGPALMVGGDRDAYGQVRAILESVAARSDLGPCAAHLGPGGAGHAVKMVHNAIEYAEMELIAEVYDLMRRGLGVEADDIALCFERWNERDNASFLVQITVPVLRMRDPDTQEPLVELIDDQAGQKGTGRWAVQAALDLGVAIPTVTAAVEARVLSSMKPERLAAARQLAGVKQPQRDRHGGAELEAQLAGALWAGRVCAYAQGLQLARALEASLDVAELLRIWREGCILRSQLVRELRDAYVDASDLANPLLHSGIGARVERARSSLEAVVNLAQSLRIPVPAFASGLAYLDGYRSAILPQRLTQAQRDAFGSHHYRRIDRPGDETTDWLGSDAS